MQHAIASVKAALQIYGIDQTFLPLLASLFLKHFGIKQEFQSKPQSPLSLPCPCFTMSAGGFGPIQTRRSIIRFLLRKAMTLALRKGFVQS